MEVVKVMKDGLLDVEATGVKGVAKWMPISAWFGKERGHVRNGGITTEGSISYNRNSALFPK